MRMRNQRGVNKMQDEELRQAVDLINSGNKDSAFLILKNILHTNRDNELAWLWLSVCVNDAEDKKFCYQEALRINPFNWQTQQWLQQLVAAPIPVRREKAKPVKKSNMYLVVAIACSLLTVVCCLSAIIFVNSPLFSIPEASQAQNIPSTAPPSSPAFLADVANPISKGDDSTAGCKIQGAYPDPKCTPGDVFNVTREQVCTPNYSSSVRDVSQSVKDQVYATYGITSHIGGQYEVDHFISLELGGSNEISNLWPEAASPKPGCHEKDVVENYLHDQVCSGAMELSDAQHLITTDWIRIYNEIIGNNNQRAATLEIQNTAAPHPTEKPNPSGNCCMHCSEKSKPCGDACIPLDHTCHTPPGCACK
jgi:hypothetical protein